MPRAKKKTKIDKSAIRISSDRKSARRKTTERRTIYPGDVFWTKVVNGFKKLLSPAFPK